ncbi:MAG: chaperonin GroEL [Acidimicrobiia bacterium]|nr:chaperonin GroEL [Acidimicrobiia bacterium]
MSTHSHLLFEDEARTKLLEGARTLADAVRPTLGPEARSVLIEKKYGQPIVCDDGVTIAKQLHLEDQDENLGAQMLKAAATRTGDLLGDGTTTSTLLAYAIFREGLRNVTAGSSAIRLKRGLERGLEVAVDSLAKLSRPVANTADTVHVASVSAHNDEQIGRLVADAIDRVGHDGVVEVESAQGIETTLEVVEGLQFDKGYLSPYFVTDPEAMEAVLDRPSILLIDKKLTSMAPLLPLLDAVVQAGLPLVVIAETIEAEALATLVVNKIRGTISVVGVKAPGFGERRRAMLDDIAVLTKGMLISEDLGQTLETVTLEDLGRARRVIVSKDATTIIGGEGSAEAVRARIDELKRQIETTTSDWDREKLEERVAKLAGGVAIIKVGATSEAEVARKRDAFDDAISATKAAITEGVVPGGGVALVRAMDDLDAAMDGMGGDELVGMRVLRSALEVPCRQIAANGGLDAGVVVRDIADGEGFFGLDARDGEYKQLDEAGVLDPAKVVRVALENAVGVAGTLLLAEATLTEIEEEAPAPLPPDLAGM